MTESHDFEQVNILLPHVGEESNFELVARILEALRAHPATRVALDTGVAAPPAGFVSLADVGDGPPPAGVPFYNEAIGVLTVPAPRGDAVAAVRSALGNLAEGLDIQPESTFRTQ